MRIVAAKSSPPFQAIPTTPEKHTSHAMMVLIGLFVKVPVDGGMSIERSFGPLLQVERCRPSDTLERGSHQLGGFPHQVTSDWTDIYKKVD